MCGPSALGALIRNGASRRPIGGVKLRYSSAGTGPGAMALLALPASQLVGNETSDTTAREVARALMLLEVQECDAAHDIVASGDLFDADAFYVHALIHRAEGSLLGDPPANVQGYLNSNYWLLRTAHAVADPSRASIRIGTVIPADYIPEPHPIWRELAMDPAFAELKSHPTYRAVQAEAAAAGGYKCGRFNTTLGLGTGFDPFAFTLCCEVCHRADEPTLRTLLERLQSRETELVAAHLLTRAGAQQSSKAR